MFYGCLHSGVQSEFLRWRLNTGAPLKRQIGDELELNDDLTVILAGSCGTSLQSVTWKAGSLVCRQHQRADGRTKMSFSSDPWGAKIKRSGSEYSWIAPASCPNVSPHFFCLSRLQLWRFNLWFDWLPPPPTHDAAGWDVKAVKG